MHIGKCLHIFNIMLPTGKKSWPHVTIGKFHFNMWYRTTYHKFLHIMVMTNSKFQYPYRLSHCVPLSVHCLVMDFHMTQNKNLENEISYKIPWKITTLFNVAFSPPITEAISLFGQLLLLSPKYVIQYTLK